MKIGFRLTLIMGVLILSSIGGIITLLLLQSRNAIYSSSKENIIYEASEASKEIKMFFEQYWYKVEALAKVLAEFDQISIENRRNFINLILQRMAEQHHEIMGIFCIFEPDVLEGNDLAFIGTPGSSDEDNGRFAPYWFYDNGPKMFVVPPDYNTPGIGDFYQIPKRTGKTTVTDPQFYDVEGTSILMSSIAVPIFKDNRFIGVVAIDISMEKVQEIAINYKPFEDALNAIFSNDGTVVAHFDASRIGKNMRETEREMLGAHFNDFVNAVSRGERFTYELYNAEVKDTFDVLVFPVRFANYDLAWSYTLAVPRRISMAIVNQMFFSALFAGIIVLIIGIIVALFLSRSFTKPILRVASVLKDISEGEGDLTRTIPEKGKDEISDMSYYFNLTMKKIRDMIVIIKQEAKSLSSVGEDLSTNMNETASTINEISANIRSIRGQISNQSASVTETNTTMGQIISNIDKLNGFVEKQFLSVSQSSSAIEEMLANIQSVTQTLIKNVKNVNDLSKASEVGRASLQEVAQNIRDISKESAGLLEINSVIENIASQTNLLSMNAAIEAAHAGDSGRGFAVVAGEIRKLAESSSKQSKTISDVLKKIKSSIDKIILSTDNVLNKFASIDNAVKTVSEQEEHIRNTMEEQGSGSKQILENISVLNSVTQQVRQSSNEMLENSKEVIQEAQKLEISTHEIVGGINEMSSGTQQIDVAVNRVNGISFQNKENINRLVHEISHFKID